MEFFFQLRDSGGCILNFPASPAEARARSVHTEIITNPGGAFTNTPTHTRRTEMELLWGKMSLAAVLYRH